MYFVELGEYLPLLNVLSALALLNFLATRTDRAAIVLIFSMLVCSISFDIHLNGGYDPDDLSKEPICFNGFCPR